MPGPVAETYIADRRAVTTLNGAAQDVMSGNFTVETSVDEMTNSNSAGWYEDVPCINKASGTFDIAYKASNAPTVLTGLLYAFIYDLTAVSGPYLAGTVRITKFDVKGQDVKGGLKATYSWTSMGAMTWSNSGAVTPP